MKKSDGEENSSSERNCDSEVSFDQKNGYVDIVTEINQQIVKKNLSCNNFSTHVFSSSRKTLSVISSDDSMKNVSTPMKPENKNIDEKFPSQSIRLVEFTAGTNQKEIM